MFKEGQKVVCINDEIDPTAKDFHSKYFPNWIKKDKTYTVRRVQGAGEAILLKEVRNPARYVEAVFGNMEGHFKSIRFAPLQTNEEFVEEVLEQIIEEDIEVEESV